MTLPNGYTMETTFFMDFHIAEVFGTEAVKDTFNRAFQAYKNNYIYLTELAIVMSNQSIVWYEKNKELSKLYTDYYYMVDEYCLTNLKGEELNFYFKITD